jgi:hypothetical protein
MPIKRIQPDLIVDHQGVKVYETYINDSFDYPNKYIFNTSSNEYSLSTQFDIRKVPGIQHLDLSIPEERIQALFLCIDLGVVTRFGLSKFTIH